MSKLSNPRRLCRRLPTLESLENRQLMSLTVDLRLPGGAKSASVGISLPSVDLNLKIPIR